MFKDMSSSHRRVKSFLSTQSITKNLSNTNLIQIWLITVDVCFVSKRKTMWYFYYLINSVSFAIVKITPRPRQFHGRILASSVGDSMM